MPERGVTTDFWGDPFIQSLEKDAKYLHFYLFTNSHCNQAGLYEITTKTIHFETGIEESSLPQLFEQLKKKVVWLPGDNIVWVKNFVKRQSKSPKFLIAVAKCLNNFNNNGLIKEFIEYNKVLGISIPYPYTTTTIPIPPSSSSSSSSSSVSRSKSLSNKGKRGSGGEGESKDRDFHIRETFRIFKENIGSITPILEENINLAIKEYGWLAVQEAIEIAVKQEHRTWRYIEGVLHKQYGLPVRQIQPHGLTLKE